MEDEKDGANPSKFGNFDDLQNLLNSIRADVASAGFTGAATSCSVLKLPARVNHQQKLQEYQTPKQGEQGKENIIRQEDYSIASGIQEQCEIQGQVSLGTPIPREREIVHDAQAISVGRFNQDNLPLPPLQDLSPYRLLKSAVRPNGKFRVNNSQVHLKYSYHFDEVQYLGILSGHLEQNGFKIELYSIVRETGKDIAEGGTNHKHMHVLLRFSEYREITDCRFFDYNDGTLGQGHKHVHPSIYPVANLHHWNACVDYHYKDGVPYTNIIRKPKSVSVRGPKFDAEGKKILGKGDVSLEQLQLCKSAYDVVQLAINTTHAAMAGPLITAWKACRPPIVREVKQYDLYAWQQLTLNLNILYNIPNDRMVPWIYDPIGDSGKSWLGDYLMASHNSCVVTTTNVKDALYLVKKHTEQFGQPPLIVFDMSRSTNVKGVYAAAESLKSLCATSGKFDSSSLDFTKHSMVIIFSNSPPNIEALSMDRWIVHIVDYTGESFEYTFLSDRAKMLIDSYTNIEIGKQKIAKENDMPPYEPCLPFGQQIDIKGFTKAVPLLNFHLRKKYWDAHMHPFIKIMYKPIDYSDPTALMKLSPAEVNGGYETVTTIQAEPMTLLEIQKYEKYKENGGKDSIKYTSYEKQLRDNEEKVLNDYRESVLEEKKNRPKIVII